MDKSACPAQCGKGIANNEKLVLSEVPNHSTEGYIQTSAVFSYKISLRLMWGGDVIVGRPEQPDLPNLSEE